MSTKRVRFGSQSVKSSTRSSGTRSGSKATKEVKAKKKPDWDTTVSDLTVHKLSKEEQVKRSQSFQSKNAEAAKHDLYEKAKGSFDLDISGNLRPSPVLSGLSSRNRNTNKMAVLHQALHGKELHEVLAESDRALAVVRDLFGDDPKRYTCQPNVTVAPHIITDKGKLERTILESSREGPNPTVLASPGGIRDESVLELAPRKPALNELPSPTSAELEDDTTLTADDENSERAESADLTPHSRGYRPSIDLTRFQKLIENEDKRTTDIREETHHKMADTTRRHQVAERFRSGQREEDYTPSKKHEKKHEKRHEHSNTPSLPVGSSQYMYVDQYSPLGGGQPRSRKSTQDCQELLGEYATKKQEQDDDNSSVAGMSELSSIPPETEGRANITVESEASSVQPLAVHLPVGRGGTSDQQPNPPLVAGRGSDGYQGELENDKRKHQVMSSLSQHPLHVVHRMTPSSHKKRNKDKSTDPGHQDKVHSQLHTLEQMVQKLEDELAAYEESNNLTVSLSDITNIPPPQNQSPTHKPRNSGSLGSITKSLLSSMTKMMSYLRQSEVQLKGEVSVRIQMLQTMTEQQNLMDSLTADLIKLRSENITLRQELTDLKKTSSDQIRQIQEDFADVHKKFSSLAVSHAHQAPPFSYLPPSHLPLLPPHLLQTPPLFPPATSQSEHHTVHAELHQPPAFPHSSRTPPSAHVNVSTSVGGASKLSTSNPSHISVPSPGDVLSQAQDSPRQLEEENEGSAPQYRVLKHGVDSNEPVGRLGSKPTHFPSNVKSKFTSSAPMPSVGSLAPPPLSEALQVPGFDLPPSLNHQSNSSTSTSTTTAPSSNMLASKPAFDVEAFINSLRKNQPQLGIASSASTGGHSTSEAVPVFKEGAPAPALLSQPHPLAQSQGAKYPSQTIPTVDLSVSLLSSVPEDEDSRRECYETSEQTNNSGEQQTDLTAVFQQELAGSGAIGHPSISAMTNSSQAGHASLLLPGVMPQQHQGLANGKLKPGWFALTSHLSHS